MICSPCAEAGKLNTQIGDPRQDSRNWGKLASKRDHYHKQCPGGTWCDCQHKSGYHWITRP